MTLLEPADIVDDRGCPGFDATMIAVNRSCDFDWIKTLLRLPYHLELTERLVTGFDRLSRRVQFSSSQRLSSTTITRAAPG